jgi:uncharacterized membrane protein YcjF (UPF0283 family)
LIDTAPEPFLLLEPEAALRLEVVPALLPNAKPVRWPHSPILAGAAILGIGIPVLWALWLVSALFDRWGTLGWVGLMILMSGIGLIGVGIGRELRSLAALRRVDQFRAAKVGRETLPEHAGILPALAAADTPEAMLALLRAGPAQAEVAGRICTAR